MSYLRVLAPLWGEDTDKACVDAALNVASCGNAQVMALIAEIDPLTNLAWVAGAETPITPSFIQILEESMRVRATRAQKTVDDARAGLGASGPRDVLVFARARGLNTADVIADACAWCDVATFVDGPGFAAEQRRGFTAALIAARTPCLLVRNPAFRSGAVAIAWDGGGHAGRALRAAMPFVLAAKRAIILHAPRGLSEHRRRTSAPDELRALLLRQGVETSVKVIEGDAKDGFELLRGAEQAGASLFVSGAFGHSKMQEFLFGGATQSFIDASGGPSVLLAH